MCERGMPDGLNCLSEIQRAEGDIRLDCKVRCCLLEDRNQSSGCRSSGSKYKLVGELLDHAWEAE